DLVHDFRVRYRVDLVHADDLAVASEVHFVSTADDVEMSDAHVILDDQLLHARDDVEVADLDVLIDRAFAGVDDADTDADSLANVVAEEEAIDGALEKRWQDRDCG